METGWSCKHMTLINELTEGMEMAKQLKLHLNSTSTVETRELLLQRMLSSFEKALLILKWSGSVGEQSQTAAAAPATVLLPESSISVDGSPGSEDFERGNFKDHQDHNDVSKKRKALPTWTDQVRICSDNGLEGPNDDGYSWRKYGQKDILGANYPRSYYRCTYRSVQNCWATKQVQRSDDDPTIFEITYRGRHTCNQGRLTAPEPPSPEKQEPKQIKHYISHQQQQQQPNELLLNFQTNLKVNTKDLANKEMASTFSFPSTFGCMNHELNQNFPFPTLVNDNVLENYSSSFVSPATSGSNFFSVSPCQMNSNRWVHHNLQQHSESDLTEIISATTSATNSPIVDLDFSIDPVFDLDSNFPFDTPGFFN